MESLGEMQEHPLSLAKSVVERDDKQIVPWKHNTEVGTANEREDRLLKIHTMGRSDVKPGFRSTSPL